MKKNITARKRSLGQGDIYRLQTKLRKGNVFHKRVKNSVHRGVGVYTRLDRHPAPWADTPGQTPPPPPPRADTNQEDGYCSRQYTSYWNAFLFHRRLSVYRGRGSPWQRLPWTETSPGTVKSGRYASYWNTFLFVGNFLKIDSRIDEVSKIKSRINHPILRGREGGQGCWLPLLVIMFLHFGIPLFYLQNLDPRTVLI